MGLLWPWMLLLLLFVPLLAGVYIWMLRRKRRYAVRYSSLVVFRDALCCGRCAMLREKLSPSDSGSAGGSGVCI